MASQLGATIQRLRKEAGLTQTQLAQRCGWAMGTIQQYERGVREPRLEKLLAISSALNVPVAALVEQDDALAQAKRTKSTERPRFETDQEERRLILRYRQLSDEGQRMVRIFLDSVVIFLISAVAADN